MHIRQYRPSDKQALRRVCAVTAPAYSTDARRDALYAAYLDYYIDCEPEYCFVAATDADEAVGYVICAPDFKRYRESYFSKRLPYSAKLLKSAPDVWLSKRAEAMIVKKIALRYPAHLHIDILPEGQRMGLGTALIDKLREKLGKIGDCVLVVGDLQLVKIHVHTNNPGKALEYALQLGELDRPKIENMLEQHRALQNGKKSAEVPEPKAAPAVRPDPVKEAGMVAICTGSGLKSIFGELGVDLVIEGGQTMNPSVDDIVNAVDSVPANTVYILPNNSNIVLAAEQAKELTKAKLVVIATKNIPQGIAAAISFDPDGTPEQNVEAMSAAAARVRSGQVTHAVRETEMDGFMLKNGDIIGIYHGVIVAKGEEIAAVTRDVIDKMTDDDTASITLYYGEGVTEADAEELVASVQEDYPFYDVVACRGGQNHYYYYISVE